MFTLESLPVSLVKLPFLAVYKQIFNTKKHKSKDGSQNKSSENPPNSCKTFPYKSLFSVPTLVQNPIN